MKYWNRFILILVTAMTLFIIGLNTLFNSSFLHTQNKDPIYVLSEGWTVTYSGSTYDNVVLSSANIGVQNFNDVVTMSITLPDYDVSAPVLYFASALSEVEVSLDDKVIYTFGSDYFERFTFIPKIYNNVPLPYNFAGRKLKITLTSKDVTAFSGLSQVYIGNRQDISLWQLQSLRLPLFVGIFLIVFASLLFILAPYIFLFNNKDIRIVCSALISMDLGLYILSYNKLIYLFTHFLILNTFIEYLSLYLVPSCILLYLCSISKDTNLKIFLFMLLINILLTVSVVIIHFMRIAPITRFTSILHGVVFIEMPITVVIIVRDLKQQKKVSTSFQYYASENIILLGLIIFMSFSFIDIIKFNVYKYMSIKGEVYTDINYMTIGSLVFMICVLLNYLFYTVNSLNLEIERLHLVGLAYSDALTGLANRARCEQVMENLTGTNGSFSIVSMDMDYLKKTNDSLGHEEGDRLIVGFATILNQVFWDAELIGRMGGDEFIVISKDLSSKGWSKKLHEFNFTIAEWNKKETKFQYSASIGFASSSEAPGHSAIDVYMLADSRMYAMKHQRHMAREGAQVNA